MATSSRTPPGPAALAAPSLLLARQPICDRNRRTTGYELLFRDDHRTIADVSDGAATSRVLVAALADVGLDALVGHRPAWVNVTGDFLLEHEHLPVPADRVVLEVLEGTAVTAELLERLRDLRRDGFVLAADDFELSRETEPLLDVVSFVKLDLRALGRRGLREHVIRLRDRPVKIVAEKVETADEFEFALDCGCSQFQGWFYAKPDPVRAQRVPSHGPGSLARVAEVGADGVSFEELERIIMVDAGLTYRLLRFLNSAFIAPRSEITTIRQALTLLGERAARQWMTVICLADMTAHAPVLLESAILRARACELVGGAIAPDRPSQTFFTCGLFSIAEALVGQPLPGALDGLALSPVVRDAIASHSGPEGAVLAAVLDHEAGRTPATIDPALVAKHGTAAARWTATLIESLPLAD